MKPSALLAAYLLTAVALIAIGWYWSNSLGQKPLGRVDFTCKNAMCGFGAGAAFLIVNIKLYQVCQRRQWFAATESFFQQVLFPLLLQLDVPSIFVLSLAAGISEEFLFRGPMQSDWGIVPAALVFGGLHTYSVRLWPYGVWAVGAGIFFGALMRASDALTVPMVAHFVYDLGVLLLLKSRHIPHEQAKIDEHPY